MIDIGGLLGPLYLIEPIPGRGFPTSHKHFPFSLIDHLINLIDNDINFMGGQLMKIPIRRHHQKWGNDNLTIKHQPNELDIIISVFFPKIVSGDIGEFREPLIDPYFLVFGYFGEVRVVGDLSVNQVELLVVGRVWTSGGVLLG